MQKRCAPAASAARACSRICSGLIIACIGVSASAYFDCAQKPQSSAQPPDLAFTSEQRSVESPKRSMRASNARSTSSRILSWSSISPRATASSYVISGGKLDLPMAATVAAKVGGGSDGGSRVSGLGLAPLPPRCPLLRERAHSLAEVLCGEAGLAQSHQLFFQLCR